MSLKSIWSNVVINRFEEPEFYKIFLGKIMSREKTNEMMMKTSGMKERYEYVAEKLNDMIEETKGIPIWDSMTNEDECGKLMKMAKSTKKIICMIKILKITSAKLYHNVKSR